MHYSCDKVSVYHELQILPIESAKSKIGMKIMVAFNVAIIPSKLQTGYCELKMCRLSVLYSVVKTV